MTSRPPSGTSPTFPTTYFAIRRRSAFMRVPEQADRAGRTVVDGTARLLLEATRDRAVVLQARVAVIVELDHVGDDPGADPVAHAQIRVDGDPHRRYHSRAVSAISFGRIASGTTGSRAARSSL